MTSNTPQRVFWLYGLSGAGKTTLACQVAQRLQERGLAPLVLDGDALRSGLCRDLGFAQEDRLENVRRTAELARLLSAQGHVVISALMTPHESMRQLARSIIGDALFYEVYLRCDYSTCARRDTKGLYARADAGGAANLPGKDMAFEEPSRPDLILETGRWSVEECVETLRAVISQPPFLEASPHRPPCGPRGGDQ